MNDFVVNNASVFMYADDTTILCKSKDEACLEEESLTAASDAKLWFADNGLLLNEEKTQSMYFTLQPSFNNQLSIKYLGIYLDSRMDFKAHVLSLLSKLSKSIYLLRQLRSLLSRSVLRMTYFAVFHSHLSYATLAWGNSSNAYKVFLLQKQAVRTIYGAGYTDHCRPIFKDLKILTLSGQYILDCILYAHSEDYQCQGDHHGHDTRNRGLIALPKCRLSKMQQSFKYQSVIFYNKIPPSWKKYSLKKLKSSLKLFLLEHCFYSTKEFLEYCDSNVMY